MSGAVSSEHLDTRGAVIDSLLEFTDLVLLNEDSRARINYNGKLRLRFFNNV